MPLELFICPAQDKIVRGTDIISSPDAQNPEKLSGKCPLCGAAIEKPVIHRDKTTKNAEEPHVTHLLVMPELDVHELLKKFDGRGLAGTDSAMGSTEKPSGTFWTGFVESIRAELPDAEKQKAENLAVMAWYGEMSEEQRQVVLDRFRDTGEIKAEETARKNPQPSSLPSGLASNVMPKVNFINAFWRLEDYEEIGINVGLPNFKVSVEHPSYSSKSPEFHEAAGYINNMMFFKIELKELSREDATKFKKPPFVLTLYDFGMYGRIGPNKKITPSPVKNPPALYAGLLQLVTLKLPFNSTLPAAKQPAKRIAFTNSPGYVDVDGNNIGFRFRNGRYAEWSVGEPFEITLKQEDMPDFTERWYRGITQALKIEKTVAAPPESEIEGVQLKIEEKEARYEKYLEDLIENDPEAYREKNVDFYDIAALVGEQELSEYDALMRKRDELQSAPVLREVKG